MISVCMATYNGAKFIKEQVDSILSQLDVDDELIVSDDGSTDDTMKILRDINDNRIKIFKNEGNNGVVPNFESALKKALGDYIFLCDQDDVWLENKVEICVKALQDSDLVVHDAIMWDGEHVIEPSFVKLRGGKREGYIKNLIKNNYIGCCMVFNRKVLNKILPFPNEKVAHDVYIGLMASRHFRVKLIDDSLILFRRHGSNASSAGIKSKLSLLQKISYRLEMLKYTF